MEFYRTAVHICLYNISLKCSYNAHSISSLVCESFFSTVSSKDPHKLGCPKAADIPKIMGDIITIENYKNHTDLNFHLETTFKPLYPYQQPHNELGTDCDTTTVYCYQNHAFDLGISNRSKKLRDVTQTNKPLKGGHNVCSHFFKCDKQTVLPVHQSLFPQEKDNNKQYVFKQE